METAEGQLDKDSAADSEFPQATESPIIADTESPIDLLDPAKKDILAALSKKNRGRFHIIKSTEEMVL